MQFAQRLVRLEAARSGVEEGCPENISGRTVPEPGEDGLRNAAAALRGPDGGVHVEQDKGETEAALQLRARKAHGSGQTGQMKPAASEGIRPRQEE